MKNNLEGRLGRSFFRAIANKSVRILTSAAAIVYLVGYTSFANSDNKNAQEDNNPVVYVDKDNNSGPWDGAAWQTAFTDIQQAVDTAYTNGSSEVWVGEGVYTSSNDPVVVMKENVHLFGGFIGIGEGGLETLLSQRNWNDHETIIDGENTRRCVIGADATLDGFVVRNGWNEYPHGGKGGGMYNESSSPIVTNCKFIGNSASYGLGKYDLPYGAGMYNKSSSPTITNSIFENNVGGRGCGIYNIQSTPIISNCLFLDNFGNFGGGIYTNSSDTIITNCRFENNKSNNGGGMYIESSHNLMIINCMFSNNIAHNYYLGYTCGGAIYNLGSSPTVINCTFTDNSADSEYTDSYGGAIYNSYSSPTVINSIFWNNTPNNKPSEILTYSNTDGGWQGEGNINIYPQFVDPENGDYHLLPTSPCIDAGQYIDGLTEDFEGDFRPYDGTLELRGDGSDFDIGADEFYVHTDWDGDGLDDHRELLFGTDPHNADTDNDYRTDGYEIGHGTDPLVCDKPDITANVSATANIEDVVNVTWASSFGATDYLVYRSTSNNHAQASAISDWLAETRFTDTTAASGEVYNYWIVARNGCVVGDFSSPDQGSVLCQVPAAPANVNATDNLADMVEVTWNASPEVEGANNYRVYRGLSSNPADAAAISGVLASGITSFTDPTAQVLTGYNYFVSAENVCGTSPYSSSDQGSVLCQVPNVVTGVNASDGTNQNAVNISWNRADGADAYTIYRSSTDNLADAVSIISGLHGTSYTDTTAEPPIVTPGSGCRGDTTTNVVYAYWVRGASDGCGEGQISAPDTGYVGTAKMLTSNASTSSGSSGDPFIMLLMGMALYSGNRKSQTEILN